MTKGGSESAGIGRIGLLRERAVRSNEPVLAEKNRNS